MEPIARLLSLLRSVKKSGKGHTAKCPSHDDQQASLSIGSGDDGRVLIKCFAGCTAEQIVSAVGLTLADLFPQNGNGAKKIVATYDYQDESSTLLFQSVRYEPKDFSQRRPDGNGGWVWNLDGVRRVLYRLPEILNKPEVYIAEGEKDVDRLWSLGIPATTNPQGAGKWREEYNHTLAGKRVVILSDNDEAGELHVQQVAHSLLSVAAAVKIIRLPGLPPKGDVFDWLSQGHTKEELIAMVEAAPILQAEDLRTEHKHQSDKDSEQSPWLRAKSAPMFLAEEEKEFQGLAKDLLAPGAITLIASPKGIGKTQVVHALGVALGSQSGVFRGEYVRAVRVLLLDRENPVSTLKKRLRAWGAAAAENLLILTRQDAPDLKNRGLWAEFPAENYDVVIVDSVGASTEGITEKEGKQNSEVLATLLDLAHRNIAILLLQNTEKTGTNIRGRGEWADRADIQYEVRDATGFIPFGKRPWFVELPAVLPDGAANWAERAARRKGRTEYRLAFIPAKFRLAAEPDPFCLEISLPENEPWTLRDVTAEVVQAGEDVVHKAEQAKSEKLEKAMLALAEAVKDRAAVDNPILKTEAEALLCEEYGLTRKDARAVIADGEGTRWEIKPLPAGRGRGTPKALYPIEESPFKKEERQSKRPSENPYESQAGEAAYSADRMEPGGRVNTSQNSPKNAANKNGFTSPSGKSGTAEKDSQKSPSNGASKSIVYSAAEEVETEELAAAEDKKKDKFDWATGQQGIAEDDAEVF